MVLPLLESDLLTVMQAVTNGTLDQVDVTFKKEHACCVIMASDGYPASYKKGYAMTIPEDIAAQVYVAGALKKDGKIVTNGGRVLGCTAVADTLKQAIADAYALVDRVDFENAYWRHDIGARALQAIAEE